MSENSAAAAGLYTCDLICFGAASPGLFAEYLGMLGAGGTRVVGYEHRPGDATWEATRERADFADGASESGTARTLAWQRAWSRFMVRPSCYGCGHHSTSRPGDLTIGDFWGIRRTAAADMADDAGVSCLLANDARGLEVMRGVAPELELRPSDLASCANVAQPMLSRPPTRPPERAAFMADAAAGGFEAACVNHGVVGPARRVKDAAKGVLAAVRGGKAARGESARVGVGGGTQGMDMESTDMLNGDRDSSDWPLAFAAKNRDDGVRRRSSSGGVFHALAGWAIGNGGVVYGCAFDASLRAVHIRCETMGEAERCMGSKYSQSDMGDSVRLVRGDLAAGRLVLFTGTPCQVDAVRRSCAEFAGGGSLILADVVCHGVPSPGLFRSHLAFLESRRGERVARYEHRPKEPGWGHVERVVWEGGRPEQGTRLSDSWRRLFYGNRMLRPTCCSCPYASARRAGDLTIADYWGVGSTGAAAMDDGLGVSLVLANDARGLGVLGGLDVELAPSTLAEALPGNPMLERPSAYRGDRGEPWRLLEALGYEGMLRGMRYWPTPLRAAARRGKALAKRALGR